MTQTSIRPAQLDLTKQYSFSLPVSIGGSSFDPYAIMNIKGTSLLNNATYYVENELGQEGYFGIDSGSLSVFTQIFGTSTNYRVYGNAGNVLFNLDNTTLNAGFNTDLIQPVDSLDSVSYKHIRTGTSNGMMYTPGLNAFIQGLYYSPGDIWRFSDTNVYGSFIQLYNGGLQFYTAYDVSHAAGDPATITPVFYIDPTGIVTALGGTSTNWNAAYSALSSIANLKLGSVGITIGDGTNVITTGVKGYIEIPYTGTITGWTALGVTSGTVQIDVYKTDYASYPTSASIVGGNPITITSAVKNQDNTITGWTTAVTAGDIIAFNVDSAALMTKLTIQLHITKA